MKKQKFLEKFLVAFFILVIFKVIAIFAQMSQTEMVNVTETVFKFIFFAAIAVVAIVFLQNQEKDPQAKTKNIYSGGGGAAIDTSLFDKLKNIYEDIARKHIEDNEYKKAAIVYMNLLKDNYRAAATLEEGGFYNEAAIVFLRKVQSKVDAANCYVKAKQYDKAITLYKELQQKEKVGDLYKEINDIENAFIFYKMVVDDYIQSHQIVKGSLIYRNKMGKPSEAQETLLQGWKENKEALNCLNNYFANIPEIGKLENEIKDLYGNMPPEKKLIYLEAMKTEFKKDQRLQNSTRNIAYDIIAENISGRSEIVNDLKHFNPNDEVILKDISRYKTGRNKMFRN
ncbi:tetratricopeptide repeat protein [Chryseobacterium sp. GP-SGM7]|uniref:tetratricopeptide repeat protein n=1 Tax=Chryseobacterium sp. GP-SGM7 TaxID=3411323 RepID=UPI003B922A90